MESAVVLYGPSVMSHSCTLVFYVASKHLTI